MMRSIVLSATATCLLFILSGVVSGQNSWYLCGKDPNGQLPAIPPLQTSQKVTLQQVQVLVRHGDRSSFPWYPKPGTFGTKLCWPNDSAVWDCQANYQSWPGISRTAPTINPPGTLYRKLFDKGRNEVVGTCDVGQLTLKGYYQEVANGKMLRDYYVDKVGFLPSNFTADEANMFHLRSDDIPRTVLSAQGVFNGLYPPEASQVYQTNLVDIHTRSLSMTVMATNPNTCPRAGQLEQEVHASKPFLDYIQQVVTPLQEKLSGVLGANLTFDNLLALGDCLNSYYCHNFALPQGLDQTTIQQNNQNSYPNTSYASQVGIGFLIDEMYEFLEAKVALLEAAEPKGEEAVIPSFLLWAGHDSTIMSVLAAYGLLPKIWVPFASMWITELYSVEGGGYAIRLMYNEKEVILPGCGGALCDWQTFSNIVNAITPTNYPQSCQII